MASNFDDPLAAWRNLVTKLESSINTASNKAMENEQFSRTVNQFTSAGATAQQSFSSFMDRYLSAVNMPSGTQLGELSTRLAAIESQLAYITRMLEEAGHIGKSPTSSTFTRPPRTKKAAPESKA